MKKIVKTLLAAAIYITAASGAELHASDAVAHFSGAVSNASGAELRASGAELRASGTVSNASGAEADAARNIGNGYGNGLTGNGEISVAEAASNLRAAVERQRAAKGYNARVETAECRISEEYVKIELSDIIRMTVENRNDGKAVIKAPADILPHVVLKVTGGVLKAYLDSWNANMRGDIFVDIAVPYSGSLISADLSGSSSLTVVPRVRCDNFGIECSGASKIRADILAVSCSMELSGASSAELAFEGGRLDADMSGASKAALGMKCIKSMFDLSGAAAVSASGRSDGVEADLSGTSKLHAANLVSQVCSVEASGASCAEVYCTRTLSAEAGGVSSIVYDGDCTLSHVSSDKISTVKKR